MMIHSIFITLISAVASLACLIGWEFGGSFLLILFASGVAVIGLPHGGLDHIVGVRLMKKVEPLNCPRISFYAAYLLVASIVICGWYVLPLVTVLGFFLLAAWHFGLEEESSGHLKWFDHLGIASRGGMLIWCVSCFQPAETASLLTTVLPTDSVSGQSIVGLIGTMTPLFIVLLCLDVCRVFYAADSPRKFIVHLARLIGFAILFACCPVLLCFTIYFCGWHSIRGLVHLRQDFDGQHWQFVRALLPMSALAVILFALGIFAFRTQLSFAESTIRSVFIGLSAVAVPHLLLHVVLDSIKSRQRSQSTREEVIACPL